MAEGSRVGDVLVGKYELLSKLGSGGMGDVYVARHRLLEKRVAIKLLHPEHARDTAMVHRLLREARAASEVHHPHIVEVLDVDREPGCPPFIVQELLDGRDLGNYLRELGTGMPAELALRLLMPVVDAIAAAHAKGIIHRDIKPENVFLAKRDGAIVPKVLDFGLAKSTKGGARLTATDVVMGTPAYMSPEQISKPEALGPASDVWSLGVLFYETLSGRLPFEADGIHALLLAITSLAPRPLAQVAPEVPRDLERIVMKTLQHDLLQRPSDAGELLAMLAELDEDLRGPLTKSEPPPPASATAKTLQAVSRQDAPTLAKKIDDSHTSGAIRAAGLSPEPPRPLERRDPTPVKAHRERRPTPHPGNLELAYVPRPRTLAEEAPAPAPLSASDWIDVLYGAAIVALAELGLAASTATGRVEIERWTTPFWSICAIAITLAVVAVLAFRHVDRREGTKLGAIPLALGLGGSALLAAAGAFSERLPLAARVLDAASSAAPWIAALAPFGLAILAAQRAHEEGKRGATVTAVLYVILALIAVALALAIGRLGDILFDLI